MYSTLASFDHVFLSNPRIKLTFVQYQSCRSFLPLQLLFWPNFKIQYEFWAFFSENRVKPFQTRPYLTRSPAMRYLHPCWWMPQRRRLHVSRAGEPHALCELLIFCNITNKIRKHTDTIVAYTQEYSWVSYPLSNVSTLSTGSGSSKDIHTCVGG